MPAPNASNWCQSPVNALRAELDAHPFFYDWPLERIEQVVDHAHLVSANPGEALMALSELKPHIHFLCCGALTLTDREGHVRQVSAHEPDARFPIARLRPSNYDVRAASAARLICVEQSVLRRFDSALGQARYLQPGIAVAGSWQAHPLVIEVLRASASGNLSLPVIPAIALKVRRAVARKDYSIAQVAQLITADPVISAKLIKIANSALYQGATPCQSVQTAVVRLGVGKVQSVVLALSSATLFDEQSPAIRPRLVALWRHLIEIAGLSAALAKLNGDMDDGIALVTGLLHEIGKIPILQRAQSYPDLLDQSGLLTDIVNGLSPTVSANTLRQWQLPEPVIDAVEQQGNWTYDHAGPCNVTDVLLVAHVLALAKAGELEQLPRLDETPAFEKITRERLSAKVSLQVLDEVRQRAGELNSLLK